MERKDFVIAALSPAKGALFRPVQVQKLFFLIDREIASAVEGPYFDFQPYDYGPFDSTVYKELEALAQDGLVETVRENTWTDYRLSEAGQERGDQLFQSLDHAAQDYVERAVEFVRKLTFSQLVSAIYKAYPEMRENSVFQA